MAKGFTATWLGDGSPEAQIITEGGIEFIKGRPVKVPGDLTYNGINWADQIRNNPMFEVGAVDEDDLNTNDDDAEVAELRADLDALGVKYAASAKAPALRAKLEEATK
jgi:hypothetical protein